MEKQKTMNTIFGNNLKRLRKRQGLSQSELAEKAGISQRMVVYYECEGGNPPIDKIKNLADALNAEITDILLDKKLKTTSSDLDLTEINTKTVKRIKQLLSLPPEDRHVVYSLLDSLVKKSKSKAS